MFHGKSVWTAGDIVGVCIVALLFELGLVVAFAAKRDRKGGRRFRAGPIVRSAATVLLVLLTAATGIFFFFMAVAMGVAN